MPRYWGCTLASLGSLHNNFVSSLRHNDHDWRDPTHLSLCLYSGCKTWTRRLTKLSWDWPSQCGLSLCSSQLAGFLSNVKTSGFSLWARPDPLMKREVEVGPTCFLPSAGKYEERFCEENAGLKWDREAKSWIVVERTKKPKAGRASIFLTVFVMIFCWYQ